MIGPRSQSPTFRYLGAGAVLSLISLTFLLFGRPSYLGSEWNSGPYLLKDSSSGSPVRSEKCAGAEPGAGPTNGGATENSTWEFNVHRDGNNHGLSESQCLSAFPKLFVELERTAEFWAANDGIAYKDVDDVARGGGVDGNGNGLVGAAIKDGELYILDYGPQPYTFTRGKATLHSLHRALSAYPDRHTLPDIEFVLTTDDFSTPTSTGNRQSPIWSYTKRPDAPDTGIWLMPDFGYWAWPEVAQVGEYKDVRRRISTIDEGLPFSAKKKQLLWRGSVAANPEIRNGLLEAARGKTWGSLKEVKWDDDQQANLMPIEDHCTYAFLAHTEGRSYSGRGKYLLNCRSVLISHKPHWLEAHHAALIPSGLDANYVQVERDWSDLERKVEFLLDNPAAAERIAENAARTFRDRYLTPAAESCYWRYLVNMYGGVSGFVPVLEGKGKGRGVKFESWVLGV
ncbi:DUF821 domain protein [Aspergillus mulundensis]|uniref:Glycosyl transferase CAP10 domain-containing protein n=1 Tax=Aspergillus mulundensis TaxID=1810919 RepID=A0A3D8RLA1_9EURO|nr:hypothetical protein DSM5745_07253 [Aspergillus mulundensis]RDW74591.1 hypothetical protein DSM5745_07253 [Aspergillus mulundensis]